MGFIQNAIIVNRNNRRLQKDAKTKYFKRRKFQIKESIDSNIGNQNQVDFSEIEKEKSIYTLKIWICTIAFLLIGGSGLSYFTKMKFGEYRNTYNENLRQVVLGHKEELPIRGYNFFVNLGNSKFEAEDIQQARYDY